MVSDMSTSGLDTDSFEAIASLAYRESGLQLVSEKAPIIQSRLRHRLKALGFSNYGEYVALVSSEQGENERRQMISALTTNVSHFFREKHHFDILVNELMPQLINQVRTGQSLRVWSAGCSNGQEAYSIAMSLLERYPELANLDFKILATDIDPKVISFGKNGCYPEHLVSGVPRPFLQKYFEQKVSDGEKSFTAGSNLKSLVTFNELNLLADWPMRQTMDAIFCRNVVIYFDHTTQKALWPRFYRQLANHGLLFLGHSERISQPEASSFINCGPTTYRPSEPLIHQRR